MSPSRAVPAVVTLLFALAGGGTALAQEPDTTPPSPTTGEAPEAERETSPAPWTPEAPAAPAALVGRVVSAATGRPLEGAMVALVRAGTGAITDTAGTFRIPETRAGVDSVEVRFIGYEVSRAHIELQPGATTRAVFLLSPSAVRVAELHVEVERARDTEVSGFEGRRRLGFGHFMSRRDIEEANPMETSDLFRRIPGVDVTQDGLGRQTIYMRREGESCRPYLYLDGRRLQRYRLDDIQPMALDAIEVYRRASEAPLRFPIGDCGAVVVWTRASGG